MIDKFAQMIQECSNIVFFGGAGVSTESGVRDYRSKDGLYNTVKEYGVSPEDILSHEFFMSNPETFYDFYRKYFVVKADPNDAHKALAKLEELGKVKAVITQNVDYLHQRAGSRNVIELHGTSREFFCQSCRKEADASRALTQIENGEVPLCQYCSGVVRPKVVLYGERLYDDVTDRALHYIENADMLIVGGTSLAVYPAASFLKYFQGKYVVIINNTYTDFDESANLVIRENIGQVFASVMKKLDV